MTEHTPQDDRADEQTSDHMGSVRPDEPLDGGPSVGDGAGGAGNEPRSSVDADRDDAQAGRSTGAQVEADAEAAEDVTGRLTAER
jgi:hypothetical protein